MALTICWKKGDIFYIPADHSYTRRSIHDTMCTMTYVHFLLPSAPVEENARELALEMQNQRKILEAKTLSGEQNTDAPALVYLQNKTTPTQDPQQIYELFGKILHTSTNRHLMHNMTLSIYLCRIFVLLSRDTIDSLLTDDTIQSADPVPKNLKRAIEYIIANYTKPITLDDLSGQCNVSKQQVIRYFKSALNTTPIQYINHYRLSKAKELLFRQPQLNIKEIAVELGFENQHYFTRLFSSTYGETPPITGSGQLLMISTMNKLKNAVLKPRLRQRFFYTSYSSCVRVNSSRIASTTPEISLD